MIVWLFFFVNHTVMHKQESHDSYKIYDKNIKKGELRI